MGIAVHRNSVKMPFVSRLNAVTTPIAKVSSQIQPLHTNVNNKHVSLLNVLLLLIVVKVVSVTRPLTSVTNQSAWDMPVAKPKRTQMVPTLVTNVSRLNAEPTITVQKQKNFVTMKPTNVTMFNARPTVIVHLDQFVEIKNVSQ